MATDFSKYSQEALNYAIGIAETFRAQLYLLHVFEASMLGATPGAFPLVDGARKEESKRLNELAVQIAHENGISVYPLLKEGVPFHQILKTAKEIPADLIVLGTHGRTGLAHAIIGSVAERVVRESNCPVFTVRPKSLSRTDEGKG